MISAGRKQAVTLVGLAGLFVAVAAALLVLIPSGPDVLLAQNVTPPSSSEPGEVITVAPKQVPLRVTVYGAVHAVSDSVLSSKLMARIVRLPLREGEPVRQGDLLVELDHRDLDSDLAIARAAAARSGAALVEMQAEFERIQRLFEAGGASTRDVEQATSQNTQAREAVAEARAQVERVETLINYARILAPADGRVVERLVEVGEMATPGRPLMRVESSGSPELWADVAQSDLSRIEVGDTAAVTVHGVDGALSGKVLRIVPAADPQSHTFIVKIVLKRHPALAGVYSGMFGEASIKHGNETAVTVPESAILHRSEVAGVYVLDAAGTPRFTLVRPGRRVGNERVILSGLSGGERVLVDAAQGARSRAGGGR
ncbi:MAG: efflux RND transporter periplasmic adaptor subunit [Nitrospirota bacterium]|nr:efflux RND transporter periplasmic adaptor subunit [Nitrospirota bacterium]